MHGNFFITFNLEELNQLTNIVLENNIRDILGEDWGIAAVNKSFDDKLHIWYKHFGKSGGES